MPTPVRIASSPWGFRRTSPAGQCSWLRRHGLGLRCGQFFAGEPGLMDPADRAAAVGEAAALARAHGLGWASCNAGGDFLVDASRLDAEIATACADIAAMSVLAPEVIIVFAGWQPRSGPAAEDQAARALRAIAGFASGHGLRVALENHGGLTATAAQTNRILDRAASPGLGVNFDAANALFHGADPLEFLRGLRHPVLFTHCKSLRRDPDGRPAYCRIRDGVIDYRPILEHLAVGGYAGIHAIEYEDPADAEAGSADDLADLRSLLAEVGLAEEAA